MMMVTKCPFCKGEIDVSENPSIGLTLICVHCSTELEVTWLFPLTLDLSVKETSAYHSPVFDTQS